MSAANRPSWTNPRQAVKRSPQLPRRRIRSSECGKKTMDNPNIRRWARDLELLNHLALFDLGLVVEPEVAASCFCGHHLRGVAVEDRLAAVVAVVEAGPVVAALARHLDLEQPMSLNCAQESAVLEQAIGAEIGESMAEPVGRGIWASPRTTRSGALSSCRRT